MAGAGGAQGPKRSAWLGRALTRQDFGPIHPSDMERLSEIAPPMTVAAGTRLLPAGETVDAVLIVGEGEVELRARVDDGRRVMAVVRRYGVIADIPLLLGIPMPFDAIASRRTSVCALDQEQMLALLRSHPSVSLRWMTSIAQRLDADRRRLLAIMSSDLTGQVAFVLLDYAERRPDGSFAVNVSQDVIAQLLGARRQSVGRVTARMRADGIIETGYRRIILRDLDALRDLMGPTLPDVTAPGPLT